MSYGIELETLSKNKGKNEGGKNTLASPGLAGSALTWMSSFHAHNDESGIDIQDAPPRRHEPPSLPSTDQHQRKAVNKPGVEIDISHHPSKDKRTVVEKSVTQAGVSIDLGTPPSTRKPPAEVTQAGVEIDLGTRPVQTPVSTPMNTNRVSPSQPESGFFDGFFSGVTSFLDGILEAPPPPSPQSLHFGHCLRDSYEAAQSRCQVHVSLVCIQFLEKHLDEEGLFRIPGSNLKVTAWKVSIDSGQELQLPENTSAHDVASLLKTYLREIPEGLVPIKFYQDCLLVAEVQDPSELVNRLIEILNQLDSPNKLLLYKLLNLCHRITLQSDINKMNTTNLAVCLATNIFKEPHSKTDHIGAVLEKTAKLQRLTSRLIDDCKFIWETVSLE